VTLSLEVPTRNAAALQDEQPSDARVFLRLSVLDPKSAQPLIIPRFPSSAPRIGGAAYTTEARK
jgi:hypothetical protein